MGAQKTILPPGYMPELDRMPPKSGGGGCGGIIVVLFSLCAVLTGGSLWLLSTTSQASTVPATLSVSTILTESTPLVTTRPTLDAWSLTGTSLVHATASPTVDYCFWLTPTATPTPTLPYTPDAWQATGTAIYVATYPPQQATATPDIPRVWCNNIPTATITATPRAATQTPLPTATPRAPVATSQISAPPQPVIPTQQPVVIIETPVIVVLPTAIPTQTRTPRPTKTATPTETATPTPTFTPTLTPSPTQTPIFLVYQSDCGAGYPTFLVQNQSGDALNVLWIIYRDGFEVVASDYWQIIPRGTVAIASAPAWANVPGLYTLEITQDWLQATPAPESRPAVVCAPAPTIEPTATLGIIPTNTPNPETTQEVTPP